jgi:hypothetical protein
MKRGITEAILSRIEIHIVEPMPITAYLGAVFQETPYKTLPLRKA